MPITLQAYNHLWKSQFEALKAFLEEHLTKDILAIEHVGSTAIPGMWAKPVIDLDIIIKDDDTVLKQVIHQLEKLGYSHIGNMGISGREAFKRKNNQTPFTGTGKEWFAHHLYLCKEGSIGLRNHLALKKHLLENPKKVQEYSALKQKLAQQFPNDIDAYIDGKTDFIIAILQKEGINQAATQLIAKENKKPTN